jgi:alpha-glucosidase
VIFQECTLIADKVESDFRFNADLSKAGGVKGVLAKVSTPFRSPWRVMMVGERPGKLIESNLILNLNESSKLEDDSWLRFGKTTWNWWNGFYQEPVDFKVGANFETIKHYIDFCADNGIEFHAIDCADASWTWYEQSKPGFAPSDDADILTPRAELQFFRALAYAKFRGVGIRLWVHWRPLSMRLEEAMKEYAKWGVEGLMVDFLDRDDQEMVQWTEKVLQVAAEHQIRIQFHGVWKPTGLRRTYPNLVNHEGALNLEFLKWSDLCTPDHNVTVPYTRMLAGPMDYHLGGFRSVTSEHFFARNDKPFVMGTRCHHLAMYVVYDNPVPMVSDGPTAYLNEPGFDFIQQVPTTWDEVRFLEGAVGEFVVIAKRKGTDWFLGAMTNDAEREIAVETDFLREGQYRVDVWSDVDALTPDLLNQTQTVINSGDIMNMTLVSGGGQVLKLTPVDP